MERQKAVIASALLAGSLMTGGVAFAITGGALDGQQGNVGKLQPTTSAEPRHQTGEPRQDPAAEQRPARALPETVELVRLLDETPQHPLLRRKQP